jgi:hypothetical protein
VSGFRASTLSAYHGSSVLNSGHRIHAPFLRWIPPAPRAAFTRRAKCRASARRFCFAPGFRGRLAGRPAGTLPPRPQGFSASGRHPGGALATPPARALISRRPPGRSPPLPGWLVSSLPARAIPSKPATHPVAACATPPGSRRPAGPCTRGRPGSAGYFATRLFPSPLPTPPAAKCRSVQSDRERRLLRPCPA